MRISYEIRNDWYLPKDNLPVKSTRQESIRCVGVQSQDITLVTIVRVHVSHLSDVPDLQTPVIRH